MQGLLSRVGNRREEVGVVGPSLLTLVTTHPRHPAHREVLSASGTPPALQALVGLSFHSDHMLITERAN